jgi:hypothetical protein
MLTLSRHPGQSFILVNGLIRATLTLVNVRRESRNALLTLQMADGGRPLRYLCPVGVRCFLPAPFEGYFTYDGIDAKHFHPKFSFNVSQNVRIHREEILAKPKGEAHVGLQVQPTLRVAHG